MKNCKYPHDPGAIVPIIIALAPLLVLFALRHVAPVVFAYLSAHFGILVWFVHDLQYVCLSAPFFQKYDSRGILLLLLGLSSGIVFLIWAATKVVRNVLNANRSVGD